MYVYGNFLNVQMYKTIMKLHESDGSQPIHKVRLQGPVDLYKLEDILEKWFFICIGQYEVQYYAVKIKYSIPCTQFFSKA